MGGILEELYELKLKKMPVYKLFFAMEGREKVGGTTGIVELPCR